MQKLMKIGVISSLGLALAIPACAQNVAHSNNAASKPVITAQNKLLMGTLGTTSSTTSAATVVIVTAAEAISSTGHTK